MRDRISAFTHHLRDALRIGSIIQTPQPKSVPKKVVVAGMGGSGIGADMVQTLMFDQLNVPITVVKGYQPPKHIDGDTLFIACSYSGNTEETLSALDEAIAKKAQIVCITSGGRMGTIAREHKLGILPMPAWSPSPRAMVGYSFVLLIYGLYRFGLIDDTFIETIKQAADALDRQEKSIQQKAQRIAKKLVDTIPIIYSEENAFPLAVRFQNQLQENAKHFAHINRFPEMTHNEIVGRVYPENWFSYMQPLYVQTTFVHPRIEKSMQVCRRLFRKNGPPVIALEARGDTLLEQYCFMIHLTDWISLFLAEENGVDPEPIEVIDRLKKALKKAS